MADVMLINPSSKDILKNAGDRIPLGLLYIATTLKGNGHKVRVRDLDHYSYKELTNEIERNPPEYAGVSVYTSAMFKKAVGLAKFLNGKCRTIAGGHHARAIPESLLPYFDTVVVGEGDFIINNIIEENLTGIVSIRNYSNIEDIPVPDRNFIDLKDYDYKQDGKPATTLISSRGCPNNCVFCSNQSQKVRQHSYSHIIKEVRQLKEYGYNDLYFYDDNFIFNKKRTLGLLDRIGKENIHYRIMTSAKSLDEDIVKELKRSGCSLVNIGIESGSDERLRDARKHMTCEDNERAIKLLHKYGIKAKGYFIFGLPNESIFDAEKTIDFALKLKKEGLNSADFYIMMPFPGTPVWNTPEEFNIEILDKDYTKYLAAGKEKPKAFHRTMYMEPGMIEYYRNLAEEEWERN